jgi:Ca2+-binding RTX toxin-like protein
MANIYVDSMIVSEADGYVDIVVRLDAAALGTVTVNYATSNGTAVSGTNVASGDYQGVSGSLTFLAGELTKVVRVLLTDTTPAEGYENFLFSLNTAVGATIARSTASIGIVDNDTVATTPFIVVRDVVVDERAGTATFVVMLGGPGGQASAQTVTVDYATGDGTALAGADYTGAVGTLVFLPGETVKTITIDISNDAVAEGAERLFLNLSGATNAVILDAQATAVIGANDTTAVAQPRISVSDAIVGEADGYVDVVVSLSAPGQNNVSVNYSYANGTAANGSDYQGLAGTLVFAPGETTKTVRLQLPNDTAVENFETFFFTLASPVNATIAKSYAQIGIVDNDTAAVTPHITVRDVVVDEKAGTATFHVLLGGIDGASSGQPVTVDYTTTAGTASATNDFAAVSGTLTFAPGETLKTVTVDITDDGVAEGAERFYLDLSDPTNATLLDARGVAVIGASDATAVAQPRISVSDVLVGEADGFVDVVVSLSAPGQNVVTVNFSYANDTAANGSDYDGIAGTLTFAPGETTKVVRLQILDDGTASEGLETFLFTLASPTNATIAKNYAQVAILDNDNIVATPEISVRDVVVDEKAGTATFYVVLGGADGRAANGEVTVDYATADGTAGAAGDYTAASGTLVFGAGETVKAVTVAIADDAAAEGAERFFLDLSGETNAILRDAQGVATIGANDAVSVASPRISVRDITVGESDGWVDVVVSLSAPGQNVVTVAYSYANATAANSTDYIGIASTLTFAPGETTKVVRLEIQDDQVAEGFETFHFTLASPTNATIAKNYAQVGIVDDDKVVDAPRVFVRDVLVDEKDGTATFVVTLGDTGGEASNLPVTVAFTTVDDTATAGLDYAEASGTLTFAAGETVKTVTVDLNDDLLAEGLERFALQLSGPTNASIGQGRAYATIGANDATAVASPRISVADLIVGESDGWVDIVVRLSAPGQNVVTVNYSYANETAANGSDYVGIASTLTFAPGETSKTVRLQIPDNATAEQLETFYFTLSGATNATIAKGFAQIAIVDDDTVVDTPGLFVRDVTVDEKAGTVTFHVLLGGVDGESSNGIVTVDYATVDGTAIGGADFEARNGTLTFQPGETVQTVTLDLNDDLLAEGYERFALELSNASGATVLDGRGDAVIGASDGVAIASPQISVSDVVVGEADGFVDLVVTLSAPGQNVVTVGHSYANVSGANGTDYQGTVGTVTFAPGETTKVVRLQIGNDVTAEGFETFHFTLSGATNATLAKSYAQVGIVDDDTVVETPTLFVRDAVVDEKAGKAVFTVVLGGPTGQTANQPITVDFATSDAGAVAGLDYEARNGTLLFAVGETVKTIEVDLNDDTLTEALERIDLTLSNAAGATIVDANGVAEIGRSDGTTAATPVVSAAGATVSEGDGFVDIIVTLSAASAANTSVNFSYQNGSAANGSDYQGIFTALHFAAGQTTKTVRIEIEDNGTAEPLESFNFLLTSATGLTVGTSSAAIIIVDDDNGIDVFSFGRSDDVYTVDQTSDIVVENPGGGIDLVFSSATYTLGAEVEHLTLTGDAAINGTGNALANELTGNTANNVLAGLGGNDTIDGGAGTDTMNGGTGDDTFLVDEAGDVVGEAIGAGTDVVRSLVSWTLGANVENLVLIGSDPIDGTGNALANDILGNGADNELSGEDGNDTLDGAAGNDTMEGGAGNDTYIVDAAGDVIVEESGIDTVQTNRTTTLVTGLENLVLYGDTTIDGTGNAAANAITGNAEANLLSGLDGNDTLTGGGGLDTLIGGTGNDRYVLQTGAETITELAAAGTDTVVSAATLTLASTLENLLLSGTAAINATGNAAANLLKGNVAKNVLTGLGGNDTLDGLAGADTMVGGTGNDSYFVDDAGDVVTEAALAGTDSVTATRSWTLGANLENLVLGGTSAISGTGNTAANRLTGNAAANQLDGGSGVDTMTGGGGNDTYIVGSAGELVIEAAGAGTDTVRSSVSHTLAANVENLVLTGAGAIAGTGNSGANRITGNGASNVITGAAGKDTLIGGAGNDFFVLTSKVGVDQLTDYSSVSDTIRIKQSSVRIGDGDTVVDGGVVRAFGGGFATSAELVVIQANLFGAITTASAAAVIGTAASNYATGATRLFVVDNGAQTGVFLFTSSGTNAVVSATELTQLAVLSAPVTNLADYVFIA